MSKCLASDEIEISSSVERHTSHVCTVVPSHQGLTQPMITLVLSFPALWLDIWQNKETMAIILVKITTYTECG